MTQIVLINADLPVPREFLGHPWPSWHSLRQRPHLIPDYEAAAHLAKLIGDKTWLRQAKRLPFIADRSQLLLRLRPLKGDELSFGLYKWGKIFRKYPRGADGGRRRRVKLFQVLLLVIL